MKLDQIHRSIASRIPSLQDLISAASMFELGKKVHGIPKASVIYPEEGGYIIISPKKGSIPRIDPNKYRQLVDEAIAANDMNILISGLRNMGFEISGDINGKIGSPDAKLKGRVEQFKSQVPKQGNKEVGGVSGMTKGGLGATKRHVTGTPDHVEVEIEYDPTAVKHSPEDALEDIDDTFVYHTHPKMANNNYFPGKTQIR